MGNKYKIYTTVEIVENSDDDPVTGAIVFIDMTLPPPPPGGSTKPDNEVTGSNGIATFTYDQAKLGETYTVTVTNVVKDDNWYYTPEYNVITSYQITIS